MLDDKLKNYINQDTVIACIGTDRCIGDCLGPLVGTILNEKGFKYPVYGTLEKPIHALNIHERLNFIKNTHPNAQIIGIDACLGDSEEIGAIRIRDYAIKPGKAVGKELPEVGVASVVGIVDSNEWVELFTARNIRLSFVMDMAKQIADILIKATKDTDQSSPR